MAHKVLSPRLLVLTWSGIRAMLVPEKGTMAPCFC